MSWQEAVLRMQEAGAALAAARVAEAEAFLRLRINAKSDNQAKAMAVVETQGQLDTAQAEFEVARAQLVRETSRYDDHY